MRKKSLLFVSIISLIITVSFISCQKFESVESDINEPEIALNDASFSPDFNWETTRNITLSITSEHSKVLNITSTDKLIRYHRGMLLGNSNTYTVKISIPSYVEKLSVNNRELTLSSNNVSVDL